MLQADKEAWAASQSLIPLAETTFSPPFPTSAPLDCPGQLVWIHLQNLFIDPKYQRPIGVRGEKNIRRIIEGFSWALFSPLIVAQRTSGKYAIIDGQHRASAALSHGKIEKVPCLVIQGTAEDEAKAFAVINGQVTAVSSSHIYFARIAAGEFEAAAFKRALDTAGVVVLRNSKPNDSMKAGETFSIDSLEKAFRRYGKDTFISAVQTVTETGDGNPSYIRAAVVMATCQLFDEFPRWRDAGERLFRAVEKIGVRSLYFAAVQARAKSGGSLVQNYHRELKQLLVKELG